MAGALKVWDGTQWQTASATGANQSVFVGPSAPPGPPRSGDLWFDTDEPSPLDSVVSVAKGGTGATSAATARSSLAVPSIGNSTSTAGAPTTGTWARGDQHLDSAGVVWTCTVAGTPGTWTAPGRGVVGYYEDNPGGTSAVTISTTPFLFTAIALTIPVIASRLYEFWFQAPTFCATSTTTWHLQLVDQAAPATILSKLASLEPNNQLIGWPVGGTYRPATSGTVTFRVQLTRIVGSDSASWNRNAIGSGGNTKFWAVDLGPA